MPNILLTGLAGEGTTDERFFLPLVQRTFADLLLHAEQQIDPYDTVWLGTAKGLDILVKGRIAAKRGLHIFCIHADTDSVDYRTAFTQRVAPFLQALNDEDTTLKVVPILPVQQTEAWMLGDVEMLRRELGTELTAIELGIHGSPERYADAKQQLIDAIRIANTDRGPHLQVSIADLYTPLGENIRLEILERLPSYARFKEAAREALREMRYLR